MNSLPRPPCCPGSVFDIMLSSWERDREERPHMYEIRQKLEESSSTFPRDLLMTPGDTRYFTLSAKDDYIEASEIGQRM